MLRVPGAYWCRLKTLNHPTSSEDDQDNYYYCYYNDNYNDKNKSKKTNYCYGSYNDNYKTEIGNFSCFDICCTSENNYRKQLSDGDSGKFGFGKTVSVVGQVGVHKRKLVKKKKRKKIK